MPKGKPNKRYTAEFTQSVVETSMKEVLSYSEPERLYEVDGHARIQSRERIYLSKGPEGSAIEH